MKLTTDIDAGPSADESELDATNPARQPRVSDHSPLQPPATESARIAAERRRRVGSPVRPLRLSEMEADLAAHDRDEEYVRPEVVEVVDRVMRDDEGNVIATWTHSEYAQPRTEVERNNRDMLLCCDAQSHCRGEPDEQLAIEQYIRSHGGDDQTVECSRRLRAMSERRNKTAEPPAKPLTPAQAAVERAQKAKDACYGQRCYAGTRDEIEAAIARDESAREAAEARLLAAEAWCGLQGEWIRCRELRHHRRILLIRRNAAIRDGVHASWRGEADPYRALRVIEGNLASDLVDATELIATAARVGLNRERAVAVAQDRVRRSCWTLSSAPPPPTKQFHSTLALLRDPDAAFSCAHAEAA